MKDHFKKMLAYNRWANRLTLQSLKKTENEKSYKIIGHILDAQITWLVRIKEPEKASKNFWNIYSLEELNRLSEKSNDDLENFLGGLAEEDLNKIVQYENSKGNKYSNKISDILTHVMNHSTYHRGQIAALIRSEGGEPPVTDFIAYSR